MSLSDDNLPPLPDTNLWHDGEPVFKASLVRAYAKAAIAAAAQGQEPRARLVYFQRDGSTVEDCLPVVGDPAKQVDQRLITRVVPLYTSPPPATEQYALLRQALFALDKARERLIGEAPYFAQETVEAIRKHLGQP